MRNTKKKAINALNSLATELDSAGNPVELRRALAKFSELRKLGESAVLAEALDQHSGNLVHACKALGIPHRTAARWIAERPELARELKSARRSAA
jgi:transcriptional regulator with PAS, ATPase and Fis domain